MWYSKIPEKDVYYYVEKVKVYVGAVHGPDWDVGQGLQLSYSKVGLRPAEIRTGERCITGSINN